MEQKRLRHIAPIARLMNLELLVGLSGQRTIFPFYHVVSDHELPHIRHLYSCRNEAQFEKDLEVLLKSFDPISIDQYLEEPSGRRRRRMVLSFDDGLAECNRFIAPLLKSKGIPAIFFLNNDFIDNRGLFYRYKSSILIDHLKRSRSSLLQAAEYMEIPEQQVITAVRMINYRQIPLLDALALHVELDFAVYLRDQPIYMTTDEVNHLLKLGFHIGAHGNDHPEFFRLEERKMVSRVSRSMTDLQERFNVHPACFAFPFTSDGVPERVIRELLEEEIAGVIFGTAGLKKSRLPGFIQRIPMETGNLPAGALLRAEYLYYIAKIVAGRAQYFTGKG